MEQSVISSYYKLYNTEECVELKYDDLRGYLLVFYKGESLSSLQFLGTRDLNSAEDTARTWAYGDQKDNWERGTLGSKFEQ